MSQVSSFLDSVLASPRIELPRLEIIARCVTWRCDAGEYQYLLAKPHSTRWEVPGGYVYPKKIQLQGPEQRWLPVELKLRELIRRQFRIELEEMSFLRDFTFWRKRDETRVLGIHFSAQVKGNAFARYDSEYVRAEWANLRKASARRYPGNLFQDIKDLDLDLRSGRAARRKIRNMENY